MSNNLERFVFFDTTSTSTESNILGNPNRGEELTVHVSGVGSETASIIFQGKVDFDSEEFINLAAISMSNLKLLSEITQDGIYSIPVNGINQIRAVCTSGVGSVKVYGVLIG